MRLRMMHATHSIVFILAISCRSRKRWFDVMRPTNGGDLRAVTTAGSDSSETARRQPQNVRTSIRTRYCHARHKHTLLIPSRLDTAAFVVVVSNADTLYRIITHTIISEHEASWFWHVGYLLLTRKKLQMVDAAEKCTNCRNCRTNVGLYIKLFYHKIAIICQIVLYCKTHKGFGITASLVIGILNYIKLEAILTSTTVQIVLT